MAFVFKSERMTNNNSSSTNNIGPGEYLPQTDFKIIKLNKKPFLSGVKRSKFYSNDVPGPGSYYQDNTLISYLKNIQNEKIAKQNDKVQLQLKGNNIEFHNNIEKLGFLIKERRFKVINENKNLGPGLYFQNNNNSNKKLLSNKNKIENPIEINNKLEKIRHKEFSLIPTIPSKKQIFGFDVTENGDLIQKQDPDMYKTFTGEKGDTVGPGSYDIERPNNWLKSGTEWSKFRVTRDSYLKKNENEKNNGMSMTTTRYSENFGKTKFNNNNNYEISSKTMYNNYNNLNKNQIKGNKNILNCRIIKVKETNKKIIKKDNIIDNVVLNYPGPGYYFNQNTFSGIKMKQTPEYRQFFGSKLERFSKIKSNSSLGPGSYFINDNTNQNLNNSNQNLSFKEKMSRTMETFAPFNLRSDRFSKSLDEKNKNFPGPGQYEIKGTFSDKNIKFNKTMIKFGSSEKRFSDKGNMKWQFETPGPGSYINQNTNSKIGKITKFSNINNIYRMNKFIPNYNHIEYNNINKNNRSESVPPVGLYRPEMIYSIDYRNRKKILENKNVDGVAFDSGVDKKSMKKSQTGVNIGPGYYFKEKFIRNVQNYPPFNQSSKKNDYNVNSFNGPGDYIIDSYYDWNKRSFNVNFV